MQDGKLCVSEGSKEVVVESLAATTKAMMYPQTFLITSQQLDHLRCL